MKPIAIISSTILLPAALFAQTFAQPGPDVFGFPDTVNVFEPGLTAGRFLVAVLTGVILAYCFQWLLTNLTIAIGISALQVVTDSESRAKARRKKEESEEERKEEERNKEKKEASGWDDSAVKIESGIGVWAMISSAIALFLAGWLAVELIAIGDGFQAVILGLVIWGVFMGTMMYLESLAASSLLGFIFGKVKSGMSAAISPFQAAAGKLTESRAVSAQRERTVKTAEEVAAAVRKELFPEADWQPESAGIKEKVRDYISANVKPKARDFSHLGQEVKALLTDPELIQLAKSGELGDLDRAHFAEIVSGRTDLDRNQVEKMADALHSAWSRFLGENVPPQVQGAHMPALAESGTPQGMVAKYRQFKEFLRNTGREELKPERIEQELKTLVLDPKAGLSQLKEHAKELDRESLVQALGNRKDMTPEEANRIAEQIDLARSKALSAKEQAEHRAQEVRDRALARIRDHIYATNRPELDYEGFEGDFKTLFDDPKAGFEALKNRLKGLDRESLIALLSAREGTSREEAEKIVQQGEAVKSKAEQAVDQAKAGVHKTVDRILEAKEQVLERARKVEEETKRRLEEAKRISLEQAEAARKVTAAAAWWLLAIAVVSGAAAALGGLTAAS